MAVLTQCDQRASWVQPCPPWIQLLQGEGGRSCAQEAPPGDLATPVGASFLHAEEDASDGRTKGCLHAAEAEGRNWLVQVHLT